MPLLLALHTIKPLSSENGGIFSEFVANTIILHTEYTLTLSLLVTPSMFFVCRALSMHNNALKVPVLLK